MFHMYNRCILPVNQLPEDAVDLYTPLLRVPEASESEKIVRYVKAARTVSPSISNDSGISMPKNKSRSARRSFANLHQDLFSTTESARSGLIETPEHLTPTLSSHENSHDSRTSVKLGDSNEFHEFLIHPAVILETVSKIEHLEAMKWEQDTKLEPANSRISITRSISQDFDPCGYDQSQGSPSPSPCETTRILSVFHRQFNGLRPVPRRESQYAVFGGSSEEEMSDAGDKTNDVEYSPRRRSFKKKKCSRSASIFNALNSVNLLMRKKSINSTKISIRSNSIKSTKSTSSDATNLKKLSISSDATKTTKLSILSDAAKSTKVSISGDSTKTTKLSISGDAMKSTKLSISGDAMKSTKLSISGTATNSTKISTSTERKVFTCKTCGLTFVTKQALKDHFMTRFHALQLDDKRQKVLNLFSCNFCGKLFELKKVEGDHEDSDTFYACKSCKKRFSQSGEVSVHMDVQDLIRNFPFDDHPEENMFSGM